MQTCLSPDRLDRLQCERHLVPGKHPGGQDPEVQGLSLPHLCQLVPEAAPPGCARASRAHMDTAAAGVAEA